MRSVKAGHVLPLVAAVALVVPGALARAGLFGLSPLAAVLVYASAFVGAALLLAWGAELAQLDLSPGLAVALLALIAIMPEYAIDLLFAYEAGSDPSRAPLALANMTGANRLLIGLGWALVVLMGALGARRAGRREPTKRGSYALPLKNESAVDVVVLGAVSAYTLTFALRSSLTMVDTALLFGAFGFYVYRLWNSPKEEPVLMGPPAMIAALPAGWRRAATVGMMVGAGAVIAVAARPFSEALVREGDALGVSEFLMVQWVAPLATETAELVPASIFAYRQMPDQGLGTLLSSKINQWTLLVGGVPVAYAVATASARGLPIDPVQREELLLTASQSVFAVTLLADDLRLSVREAAVILGLFAADFVASALLDARYGPYARYGFSALYLALAVGGLVRARRRLPEVLRVGVLEPVG